MEKEINILKSSLALSILLAVARKHKDTYDKIINEIKEKTGLVVDVFSEDDDIPDDEDKLKEALRIVLEFMGE